MPINIVVIGAGNMGKNHIRILNENSRYKIQAVIDSGRPAANIPEGVPVLGNLELLDKAGIPYDAAVVAVPTPYHYELGMALIERRKHILMEKPLCATLDECDEVIAKAAETGVHLAVGHVERYNPAIKKLDEIIRAGWLGEPIHVATVRVGGYPGGLKPGDNVLIDLAVHDIDVVRSLFGPLRVEAGITHKTINKEVPDTAELLMRGKSGLSVSVHVNWITPTKIRKLQVTGTRGVCFVDYMLQSCELFGGNLLETRPDQKTDFENLLRQYQSSDKIVFGVNKEEPLKAELNAFADLLDGKAAKICTGLDGKHAVSLAREALARSSTLEGPFY
jgi:UDP-N-acetylglucosamine 3-dehydrogenase